MLVNECVELVLGGDDMLIKLFNRILNYIEKNKSAYDWNIYSAKGRQLVYATVVDYLNDNLILVVRVNKTIAGFYITSISTFVVFGNSDVYRSLLAPLAREFNTTIISVPRTKNVDKK